jgi:Protein of unknown function (DUF3443)
MVRFAVVGTPAPAWRFGMCAALCLSALSCGGGGSSGSGVSLTSGGSTPAAYNVVSVVVDKGPTSTSPDVNTLFTTVTVCFPGSATSCQTIDHIQVDTASNGLRILAPVLTLSLPVQTTPNGASLLECTQFVDGYSWGPVALADVQISGEFASSVPVQVIGDANFTAVPANCSGAGTAEDTVAAFGANGILGVGVFAQDCGAFCVSTVDNGVYYACTPTQCLPTTVLLASQVPNPVTFFATDKNGVVIQLPSVASQGAATVTGSMIFGIDTQSNNKSGTRPVLTLDSTYGYFTTVFNGQSLTQSFLDTGSNGYYFNDTGLQQCSNASFTGFYCPVSPQSLSAMLQGQNAVSTSVNFTVDDAETLGVNDPSFVAFVTLAGTFPTANAFDWGLPFYYGRTVYAAIENAPTAVGVGPYVAF